MGGWPALSLRSLPRGVPSLSRFLRHGGDFDLLNPASHCNTVPTRWMRFLGLALFPNLRIPKGHNPGSLYDIIPLPQVEFFRTIKSMDVHFTSETEKKLRDLTAQSGRATADELVRDVVEGYILRACADSRNAQQPL